MEDNDLIQALVTLGELLGPDGPTYELAVVGAGALLLSGEISRPTGDLDAVARIVDGRWLDARPFPDELTEAVQRVAVYLDLANNWFNPGPSVLTSLGLPIGIEGRATRRTFGRVTLAIPARQDLITLKVWSATDIRRSRREADLGDLRAMDPTDDELLQAFRWCAQKDGRADYMQVDGAVVAGALGRDTEDFDV